MNRKGEANYLGVIMLAFITIVVGLILFQATAQQVGTVTNTIAVANESLDVVSNDTVQYLTNYRSLTGVEIYNATGDDTIIDSSYWTITNNVIHPTTGDLTVSITPGTVPENYTNAWLVSGTAQPLTYISDSGGRAMANLIIIFFAVALVAVGLYLVYEGKLKELMGM